MHSLYCYWFTTGTDWYSSGPAVVPKVRDALVPNIRPQALNRLRNVCSDPVFLPYSMTFILMYFQVQLTPLHGYQKLMHPLGTRKLLDTPMNGCC